MKPRSKYPQERHFFEPLYYKMCRGGINPYVSRILTFQASGLLHGGLAYAVLGSPEAAIAIGGLFGAGGTIETIRKYYSKREKREYLEDVLQKFEKVYPRS